MAVIRFRDPFASDPYQTIRDFRRSLDSLFSNFQSGISEPTVYPAVNIYRDENNSYVTAELPGIDSSTLDISVHGKNVTIKGVRKIEHTGEGITYHRRERTGGSFSRIVSLPEEIDAAKVGAEYKNGVLTLTLPKTEAAKPRQIEVKNA